MVIPISYDLLIPQDLPWYGHGSKHTKTYLRFRVGYLDGFENMILFIPVFGGGGGVLVSFYRTKIISWIVFFAVDVHRYF